MKIIGRKQERKELERCEKSKKSELVCVYGRRRVGKTYLVEQTFGEYFAFRAVGLEKGNTREQLKAFNQRLIHHGDKKKTIPKNWFEAFARLEGILEDENVILSPHGKKIVFLDELPWLATARSDFLLAFEEFWNRRGTQKGDLLFIVCGSATSWIIKNVLEDKGNMYRRVTAPIFVPPFTLKEMEIFFKDRDFGWAREQIMETYMVFGGLPFVMDNMNPDESLRQNIDRLLLKQRSLLGEETKKLLESTLSKSEIYGQILKYLSVHKLGIKKSICQEELKAPDGTFTRAIENLVKCGYVIEYEHNYEKGNPLYIQLVDPFILFHYCFLEKSRVDNYEDIRNNSGYYMNWRGHAFEILCLHHIDQIKSSLGIAGVKTKCFPWINSNQEEVAQIDLVIERADNITNLCEMKCTDRAFVMSKDIEDSILRKKEIYQECTHTRNALKCILISSAGVSGTAHMEHISGMLTLDDLFE